MASSYVTAQGDALDLICLREYGRTAGVVERVLVANPDIAMVAHRMPAGVTVALPDLGSEVVTQSVKLWD